MVQLSARLPRPAPPRPALPCLPCLPCPALTWPLLYRSAAEACTERQDPGPCSNYTIRYSYDLREGRCKPFYFGGCDGNRNNFRSDAECREKCEARKVEAEPTQFEIGRSMRWD